MEDPEFQRGLQACQPTPGRHERYGVLEGYEAGPPVWDLVQWSSREPIPVTPVAASTTQRTWSNALKAVELRRGRREGVPSGAGALLRLEVNGRGEYRGRARQDGEPWVHLLVEQTFRDPPALSDLDRVPFGVSVRLDHARLHRTPDYSPSRHAAQFQVFVTVQNRNRESTGFGRFLWFGIPLYDNRHRSPPPHQALDTAGSGMFIFTPAAEIYTRRSVHDGDWVSVDRDLLPLMREGLETAWRQGALTESRRLKDYRITGLNLGWEVPGILDVSMSVRDLRLRAAPRKG